MWWVTTVAAAIGRIVIHDIAGRSGDLPRREIVNSVITANGSASDSYPNWALKNMKFGFSM